MNIEPIAQRGPFDCVTACVAMLTDIDIELLPVAPPSFDHLYSSRLGAPHVNDFDMSSHFSVLEDGTPVVTIREWTELLETLGYRLIIRDTPTKTLEGIAFVTYEQILVNEKDEVERVVGMGGHALIHLPKLDAFIDPTHGSVVKVDEFKRQHGELCGTITYMYLVPVTGPNSEKGN